MTKNMFGRRIARTLCAVIFLAFGICFLRYQQELLDTEQWILSDHHTRYMPTVTPTVVLLLLMALAWWVRHLVKPSAYACAWVYAPSLWALALFTDLRLPVADGASNGFTWVGFTVWALLTCVVLLCVKRLSTDRGRKGNDVAVLVCNLAIMSLLLNLTVWASNTRAHIHNTLRMSSLAAEERYDELLKVGARNPECSRSMCAMRAYALSKQGLLADKLFTYPQHHGALGLIPPQSDSAYTFDWNKAVADHLRAYYYKDVETPTEAMRLLTFALRRHDRQPQADYLLCAYLLERDLDSFAAELPQHYALNDSLPIHYKEALIIYQRGTTQPLVTFEDNAVSGNFDGFKTLQSQYEDKTEQEFHIVDMYSDTYWCYYYYPSRNDK